MKVKYKTLADVVESLIGAFYVSGGLSAGIAIIDRLGLVPAKFMLLTNQAQGGWMAALTSNPSAIEPSSDIHQGLLSFIASSSGNKYTNMRDLSGEEEEECCWETTIMLCI